MQPATRLREEFGEIDVYLFDQLLRGRIVSGMKVLDAGCGAGRNLVFLMRAGFDLWGVDESGGCSRPVGCCSRGWRPRSGRRGSNR
jgi:2-polyprenyl-3-methyl-5-hydroxy-6-metoxy-1,4-benzoquinol methylase